ncbi:MAG: murein transglycosylase domain-containing protein [Gammaproteobacteria bacterium]|nr:murein transglycosylase domain-containing protein [Gammaproteobacteria bacterium]
MSSIKYLCKCLSLVVVSFCFSFTTSHAESFDDWKNQQQTGFQKAKTEFEEYRAEIDAAFKEYKRKTGAVWGKDNITSDGKRWISYIDKLNQRSVVDFEQGVVNVEVALPADQGDQGEKLLEQALLKAMKQGGDQRPIQQIAKQPVSKPMGKDVLSGQIGMDNGAVAQRGDYQAIASEAAANATKKTLRGDDGKTRVVYQAQLKLVPDHIRVRASKYLSLVNQYTTKYKVPAAVVLAVMETESMFNPMARSAAPAFGLMQLVPTSGARDAYRYVYKKDKLVSDVYLYNPDNNVHLGTAFLRRLNSEYLGGIKSDESRMLATIAAYNTGAGNVFRAFVGSSYSRSRYKKYKDYKNAALAEINKRSSEQVYQYLRGHLPHKETRSYLKNVTERMVKYEAS